MKKALITGATGNIGQEVIQYISTLNNQVETIAAVRDIEKAKKKVVKISRFEL